jgi:hypothetical protein
VSFRLNKEQIIKSFCVNRSEPKKKCNGKCWLSKELDKTDQKDTNVPREEKTEIPDVNFLPGADDKKDYDFITTCSPPYKVYRDPFLAAGFYSKVFHPPEPSRYPCFI